MKSLLFTLFGVGAIFFIGRKSSSHDNNTDDQQFTPNQGNLSYSIDFYIEKAKRIKAAWKQLFSNAENDVVIDVLKMLKNPDDWKQLFNSVGTFKDGWRNIDLIFIIEQFNSKDKATAISLLSKIGVDYAAHNRARKKLNPDNNKDKNDLYKN